jgi:hypothetical protein
MTRPGLQAVAVLGVATVRGGPWWTSVGYSRAAVMPGTATCSPQTRS